MINNGKISYKITKKSLARFLSEAHPFRKLLAIPLTFAISRKDSQFQYVRKGVHRLPIAFGCHRHTADITSYSSSTHGR